MTRKRNKGPSQMRRVERFLALKRENAKTAAKAEREKLVEKSIWSWDNIPNDNKLFNEPPKSIQTTETQPNIKTKLIPLDPIRPLVVKTSVLGGSSISITRKRPINNTPQRLDHNNDGDKLGAIVTCEEGTGNDSIKIHNYTPSKGDDNIKLDDTYAPGCVLDLTAPAENEI